MVRLVHGGRRVVAARPQADPATGAEGEMTKGRWVGQGRKSKRVGRSTVSSGRATSSTARRRPSRATSARPRPVTIGGWTAHRHVGTRATIRRCEEIVARRIAWFNAYTGQANVFAAAGDSPYSCPCYGHATLGARGGYEICSECGWQDDGQDEH
jgi:hypothetical protein